MSDLKTLFGLNNYKPGQTQDLKTALGCCDSVEQMIDLLKARYKLDDCKPGTITKKMVIDGLVQAVEMLNPQKK